MRFLKQARMSRPVEAIVQVSGFEWCVRSMAPLLALARIGFDELDNVIEFDQGVLASRRSGNFGRRC